MMIEAHVPAYIGDPELAGENLEKVVGLFPNDTGEPDSTSRNIWAADSYAQREEEMIEEFHEEQH